MQVATEAMNELPSQPTTEDVAVNRENHHFGARGIGLQIGEGIGHREIQ